MRSLGGVVFVCFEEEVFIFLLMSLETTFSLVLPPVRPFFLFVSCFSFFRGVSAKLIVANASGMHALSFFAIGRVFKSVSEA